MENFHFISLRNLNSIIFLFLTDVSPFWRKKLIWFSFCFGLVYIEYCKFFGFYYEFPHLWSPTKNTVESAFLNSRFMSLSINKKMFQILTLFWWRSLSYRNQSIDLSCKSMDWFLYDRELRLERVKKELNKHPTQPSNKFVDIKLYVRYFGDKLCCCEG